MTYNNPSVRLILPEETILLAKMYLIGLFVMK